MADIESNIRFGVDTTDAMASIKALQAQISAFQRQMSSSSAANAESARKLRRGLLDDLNATGQWSTSIRTIKSSSESFTTALEKNKLSMGEYFRFAGGATQKFGKLFTTEFNTIEKVARERVKDLQTQYISLGRDANGALKSIAVRPLRLDMNDLATQTAMNAQKQQIFNQLLRQGSTNLLNFGKNTQWAGRQLMVGFTIPLSIFGGMASQTFMKLEEQAIRFRRVYGELFTPPGEADEMLESLKELGKEFTKYGVAVEKTLGLAADAAAMGKTGVELLDQVTEANRLAVLGSVEQQMALETTISLTNAFGVATEDLAKKIDFLNAVENQTVVSIEDLTIAIPKAGPVVKQLGGDVEDLAFFLTAMKEGGINASEGANALKSGLASLINPTGVAAEMMKVFGINLQELNMANKGDVKGLVLDFAQALDELDPLQRAQAIEQLFGKFQFSRLSTLFQNVIQEGNQASRVLELTNATTQELAQLSSKELKAVEESTTFRFRKAIEEFQLAIAPIGEEFLKLITPIIEFANGIIEKFNGLSDGAKSFITGLTVLLGAVGPVALMTFGLLANGVANIIKGFNFVREVFLKTGNQSNILGQQIDYMTNEQLNAAAVAASLDQTHQQLIQTFSVEAGAVKNLADVYRRAFNEQQRFDTGRRIAQSSAPLKLNSGIVSVPGPKGKGDIIPAMLTPGEAVIPAPMAQKYSPLIQGMIAGNVPGFNKGTPNVGGVARSSSYTTQPLQKPIKPDGSVLIPADKARKYQVLLSAILGGTIQRFAKGTPYAGKIPLWSGPQKPKKPDGSVLIPADKARKYQVLLSAILGGTIPGFAKGTPYAGKIPLWSGPQKPKKPDGSVLIPADKARKYQVLLSAILGGTIPGFNKGVMLGMPKTGKSVAKNREAADPIYQAFLKSSYRDTPPTNYGHQIAPTTGRSFPIWGLGGVYMSPAGKKVFVKPVMDETAAMAEIRGTQIARQAHGLEAPEQRIVVIRDPQDVTGKRRFLALESDLDTKFVNNDPMAKFNEEQYFRQLVASLVRVDKDLAAGNMFGNVVADVGPAGVFSKASSYVPGDRTYQTDLPSMEEQAMVNLLGIKGGAKRAFAESTVGLMANMTADQYHQHMIGEIQRVLPQLKQTVAGFALTNPQEADAYNAMIKRLEAGLAVDWRKFHGIHSAVKPSKPKQTSVAVPGYADGVVSVPGPKGAGDIMPAMLSPGEAVIPADKAKKYSSLINAMISGNIPGYSKGRKSGRGVSVENAKNFYAPEIEAVPILADVIEKVVGEMEESARTQAAINEKLKPILQLVTATKAFNDPKGPSARSNSGVNLSHLVPFMQMSREQANQAGRDLQAAGVNTKNANFLASTTEPVKAVSNLVAALPRPVNDPNNKSMTAEEAARWIQEEKTRFTSFLYENYAKAAGVEQDDPELMRFAESVASGMQAAGAKAIDDPELYAIVRDAISNMLEGAAKDAVVQAASEYSTIEVKGRREAIGGNLALTPVGSKTPVQGGQGFTPESVGLIEAQAPSYRGYSKTKAGKATLPLQSQQSDDMLVQIIQERAEGILNDALGINSPSAEYEKISQSVTAGVREGTDDAIRAGAQLGEAVADGAASAATKVARIGRRRVTDDPAAIAAQAGTQAQQVSRRRRAASAPATTVGEGVRGSIDPATGEFVESVKTMTQSNQHAATVADASSDRLNRLNSVMMNGTFAISSLSGVLSLFGGQFAELNQHIFGLSTALFALMQIVQVLTQTKLLQLIQTRALNKGLAIQNIQTKKAMLNTAAFSGGILNVAKSLLRFLGPIGILISVVSIAGAAFAMFAAKQEEDRKRISGLGDAAFLTAEKMKRAGELLGFEAKSVSFAERATAGSAASRNATERSQIETLRADESFKADFANEINAIKNASVAEAQMALSAVAAQLAASGANPEAVDAYVRAIAQEAGRTDLNLNFAKIDFAEGGVDQISENAKKAADSFSKTFSDEVTFKTTTVANRDTLNPFDFTTVTTADMADPSEKLKTSAEAFAGVQAAALSGLASGLQNNLISVADFNAGLNEVMTNLEGLSADQASLVLPSLYEKLGISETLEGIPQVSDQMIYLKALAAGVDLKSGELEALQNANKKDIDSQRLAEKVRKRLIEQTSKQAQVQKDLNDEKEQEKFINEQIANANVQLTERIIQLENQRAAYDILIKQGYSAEDAFNIAGDAGLAAGIKAAYGAGLASKDWQDLETFLKRFLELEKKAPKSPTTGTPDKTPYEQAIESLQEQRKEIINTNVAFNKLRKAGMDTATAMRIAEDPITAAALATTKVGTEKWNRLIKAIRTTQALLSKKEIQDLLRGGKIDRADMQARVVVSNALSRLGWTAEQIEEVLSNQEFTNSLADDLKDGEINAKDLLNRLIQIKQMGKLEIDLNFTTKEGAATEFQKRYDKVVGFLEAQKQVIEVDFEVAQFDRRVAIRKAEEEIAGLQDDIDDFEAELVGIEEQEEEINRIYDERKKALDKVANANDEISKQQKSQLTLADALSQGDIAAAARAAQEMRAQNADAQVSKQGEMLELSRERQLANVRTTEGRSRKQIEADIERLKKAIFKIEEERLEPAREQIRLAEVEKNAKLDSLNKQILLWDQLSARVNQAKLKLTQEEMDAMFFQAELIAKMLENWDNIKDKTAILTIIKRSIEEGSVITENEPPVTTDPGATDPGSTPPTTDPGANGSTTTPASGGSGTGNAPGGGAGGQQPVSLTEADTTLQAFLDSGKNIAGFIKQIDAAVVNAFDPIANAAAAETRAEIAAAKDAQNRIIKDIQINMNAAETARQASIAAAKDAQNRIIKDIQINMNAAKTAADAKAASIAAEKAAQNRIIAGINANMNTTKPKATQPTVNTTTLQGIAAASRPTTASILQRKRIKLAVGGMVKRYATGGLAMGTDIVPAMLTPGEFVVRKYAVDNFGTDRLKAINNGTYTGDSVYNYEVNVNVQTDADADKIARAVISQIKQIDSQRIRSNRF